MLRNSLAPSPSISPQSTDLCGKPSPVPEMQPRSQKLASGITYCTIRLDLGIRMVSIPALGSLQTPPVFFLLLLLFSVCAREECCTQLSAAWVLEGMVGHGILFIASALPSGESSFAPGPVGDLSLKCKPDPQHLGFLHPKPDSSSPLISGA